MAILGYRKIRQIIQQRIVEGEYLPNSMLPNEVQLADEFGVTRTTVNRAMQELAEDGFIERKRKVGSRVKRQRSQNAVVRIKSIKFEIEGQGKTYDYRLISSHLKTPSAKVAQHLQLETLPKCLHTVAVHYAQDMPYVLENRWINLDTIPSAKQTSFEHISANEWLLKTTPYSNAKHTFSAMNATIREQQQLRLEPNEALFVVERTSWQADQSITYVALKYPGLRYKLHDIQSES